MQIFDFFFPVFIHSEINQPIRQKIALIHILIYKWLNSNETPNLLLPFGVPSNWMDVPKHELLWISTKNS